MDRFLHWIIFTKYLKVSKTKFSKNSFHIGMFVNRQQKSGSARQRQVKPPFQELFIPCICSDAPPVIFYMPFLRRHILRLQVLHQTGAAKPLFFSKYHRNMIKSTSANLFREGWDHLRLHTDIVGFVTIHT